MGAFFLIIISKDQLTKIPYKPPATLRKILCDLCVLVRDEMGKITFIKHISLPLVQLQDNSHHH